MQLCKSYVGMRIYLRSKELGREVSARLLKLQKNQSEVASELNITQGQLSHFLAGHFKTVNPLVRIICKYVNIETASFVLKARVRGVDPAAVSALARACAGRKPKVAVVIRVLKALEDLDFAG